MSEPKDPPGPSVTARHVLASQCSSLFQSGDASFLVGGKTAISTLHGASGILLYRGSPLRHQPGAMQLQKYVHSLIGSEVSVTSKYGRQFQGRLKYVDKQMNLIIEGASIIANGEETPSETVVIRGSSIRAIQSAADCQQKLQKLVQQ